MAKFRVKSKNLIPKERELVSDVSQLIDVYSNVEYEKIYRLIEELANAFIRYALTSAVTFQIDSHVLEKLTEKYIATFGWNYQDYQNVIYDTEQKFMTMNYIERMNLSQGPLEFFINIMIDHILQNISYDSREIMDIYNTIVTKHLKQWATEEGLGKLTSIKLVPNTY